MDEATLRRYQRRLLEGLRHGTAPETLRAELLADPELASLRAYLEGLDPHALAVAAELVARWSPAAEPDGAGP
ncbi:MAG: hypothetical protein H6712_12085 [Myxococcales bacterium]|nr:hypothetical protein [Myxococcales bacterium]MCB9714595.1 hypothetical protein [Myxococcales bacterium]